MTPRDKDLWFLPLGGVGEIGMNMALYGNSERWLMVDCGMGFDQQASASRPKLLAADPQFIVERRSQLAGIVLSHAHEDHLGALPALWSKLDAPVYASPFTAEVLRRKALGRGGALPRTIVECEPGGTTQIGPFSLHWIPVTHSTAECAALHINCVAGNVLHTADWKIDPEPLIGTSFDETPFVRAGLDSLDAVVCDSTNAPVAGHSVSEAEVLRGVRQVVNASEGRVVLACFSSNVARMRSAAIVAKETGRYFGLLGRSLETLQSAALSTGVLERHERAIQASHLGFLPRKEVLAIATGSQGEPGAALQKLAMGSHPHLDLEPGDTLIYSARVIPGNEESVNRLRTRLEERGVKVVDNSEVTVHASGHPCEDELVSMYGWLKPTLAIPVHGETEHIKANAAIAKRSGAKMVLTGNNGDLFYIAPEPGVRRKATSVGRIELDEDRQLKTKAS
ncbi:MAG: ribonuclease J [Pseudomonadota bacterium]